MLMKKHLPNFITLVNLLCGALALVSLFEGQYMQVFWLLLTSGLADFLDGLVARALGVHSPLGRELDSLADVVSFGLVPGAILYVLLLYGYHPSSVPPEGLYWPAAPAFVFTLAAAWRLGKFNLDTRQTEHFLGLSTPAATVFVVGLLLLFERDTWGMASLVVVPAFVWTVVVVLSLLMVSEVPMFSFKFKRLGWRGNEFRIIFAAIALSLLWWLREMAVSLVVVLYVLFSLAQNATRSVRERRSEGEKE